MIRSRTGSLFGEVPQEKPREKEWLWMVRVMCRELPEPGNVFSGATEPDERG